MTTCRGNCGKNYRVSDGLVGKRLRCKQCKSVIEVPLPEPVAEEPAIEPLLGLAGEPEGQLASAAVTPPSLGEYAPAPIKLPRRSRLTMVSRFRHFARVCAMSATPLSPSPMPPHSATVGPR